MSAPLLVGPGLVARELRVRREEVAWVRYVVEAHDGLASLHVADGGVVTLLTPESQAARLDAVLADLAAELDGHLGLPPEAGP